MYSFDCDYINNILLTWIYIIFILILTLIDTTKQRNPYYDDTKQR